MYISLIVLETLCTSRKKTEKDHASKLNPVLGASSPKPHPPSRLWAMIRPAQTPVLNPQHAVSQSASAWHA